MAYAAVFSLQQAMMDLFLINSESKKLISHFDTILLNFIDDLFDHLASFLSTIESLPSNKIVGAASEERRVKDAALQLHDLIDSRLPLFPEDEGDEISRFSLLLSQQLPILTEEIRSFLTTLGDPFAKDQQQQQQQQQQRYDCSFSSSDYNIGKQQNLVGLDEQIKLLKELILDTNPSLVVTPVLGMTGIGKTSLVQQVYSDPDVIDKFETRLFLHIGPRYNRFEEIVMVVLNQLGVDVPTDEDYLLYQLSEALSTTKYLIVLDDVWVLEEVCAETDFCFQLQYDFPSKMEGSRIIIISQILNRNNIIGRFILLPLLKEDDSWKLLRQTALTSEDKCTRELEKIGRKIARNCEGLPAAIIQVGENLRGKPIQEWKTLSKNEDPLVITRDDDTPLSKALYFSYMMLPQFLKVIFLYMGVFPKNYGISRSMLIKLWISEGLIDLRCDALLTQKAAGKYLDQLVCRSVVLMEKKASVGRNATKNCRLHFTFRSLCVNEAKSENFFHILKKYTDCTPENMRSQQRLCVQNNVILAFRQVHEWMESVPNARSLLCFGPKQQYPIALPLCFRLLKVLDALAIRLYEFPHQILALFHLRYLAITCDTELSNSISRLGNLEVLVFGRHHNIKLLNNGPIYLPMDIWNMHKLKQLYCMGFDLPTPPIDDSHLVLEKLLTLSGVSVHSCTRGVLSRIPMLQRVVIQIESAHDSIETFNFFGLFASRCLGSFKCAVVNPNLRSQVVPCTLRFSLFINKICLSGCGFPWKNMEAIATLPCLKVLKLRWYAFCGPEWKSSGKQFPGLRFLLLEDLDIEHWKSDPGIVFFPSLEHVIVRHCYKFKTIPDQLECVEILEVDDCSPSFVKKMRMWQSIHGTEAKIHYSHNDL